MEILILGGTGAMGVPLVKLLSAKDDMNVYVTTRSKKESMGNITYIQGNAKEVDFFSIGTNDLTQYTLAIDRQNPKLDDFYNSHHEAVLRMIRMVVENGHKEGCWVGICGELGADTSLTETFVSMGIDELSVSPSMVLKVREAVRNIED